MKTSIAQFALGQRDLAELLPGLEDIHRATRTLADSRLTEQKGTAFDLARFDDV